MRRANRYLFEWSFKISSFCSTDGGGGLTEWSGTLDDSTHVKSRKLKRRKQEVGNKNTKENGING